MAVRYKSDYDRCENYCYGLAVCLWRNFKCCTDIQCTVRNRLINKKVCDCKDKAGIYCSNTCIIGVQDIKYRECEMEVILLWKEKMLGNHMMKTTKKS